MSGIRARELAALLGLYPKNAKEFTSLDLAAAVVRGLPLGALDGICVRIAPGDRSFRNRIVPKATFARRQRERGQRLSAEESDRVARLARLWAFAVDIWGSEAAAQRFFAEPHPLLNGRVPRDVAIETEIGARTVEDILGRLKYGSAA
jgi:putative toxin-antitoxin system antitoxin component (TIGR02293 family)